MKIEFFERNRLNILLLIILVIFLEIGSANGEITYRKIDADMQSSNGLTAFEIDDFFGHRSSILIDMKKKPLFIIPDDQIVRMSMSYNTCIDISSVAVRIDVNEIFSKRFEGFAAHLQGQQMAFFIAGDFVGAPTMMVPLEKSFAFGPLTYEKAAAIIMNSGYRPNYEETCVGGKTKMIYLTKKYAFKKDYEHKRKFYPSILNNSEFWYLKEDTPIFDSPNGKIIAHMPAKEVIEQFYNTDSDEFERKGNWLKVIYRGETRWITDASVIPFFSVLDTNLFLQKFFVYGEYRYEGAIEDKRMYSDYLLKRIGSIRKVYIKEALSRFKDEKEFRRWYSDSFRKSFTPSK